MTAQDHEEILAAKLEEQKIDVISPFTLVVSFALLLIFYILDSLHVSFMDFFCVEFDCHFLLGTSDWICIFV